MAWWYLYNSIEQIHALEFGVPYDVSAGEESSFEVLSDRDSKVLMVGKLLA